MTNLSKEMLSEEEQKAFDKLIADMAEGIAAIEPVINGFTSSKLKRVLKAVTHVNLAEELLSGKPTKLEEDEEKLVDQILFHQENTISYEMFMQGINQKYNKEETSDNQENLNE
jgi:hypothetical protein